MFSSGREASQFSVQVHEQFASYKSRSGSGDLLEIKWKKKMREKKLREPSGNKRKRKKERMKE